MATGPSAAPPWAPGWANPRQRTCQPGEHRHVHAADRHQVGDAGGAEQLPVVALDGGLVAHGQRSQHTGGPGIGHLAQQRIAQVLAQPLDRVRHGLGQQFGTLPATHHAHVAGGADALLEPHQLDVVTLGVERAMGLLQPQRQARVQPDQVADDGVADAGQGEPHLSLIHISEPTRPY